MPYISTSPKANSSTYDPSLLRLSLYKLTFHDQHFLPNLCYVLRKKCINPRHSLKPSSSLPSLFLAPLPVEVLTSGELSGSWMARTWRPCVSNPRTLSLWRVKGHGRVHRNVRVVFDAVLNVGYGLSETTINEGLSCCRLEEMYVIPTQSWRQEEAGTYCVSPTSVWSNHVA